MTYEEVIKELYALANKDKVAFKASKFGVVANNALGIYHKDLQLLAKTIGRNTSLALQLFDSGIYEARILCSKIFTPAAITEALMEQWVVTFENWEICDSFCMGLFAKSKYATHKIAEWTNRTAEFEKRAGFVMIAAYCMADKKAENKVFEGFLPIIKNAATDQRLYVKKAVNWALRNIGKRNVELNKKAIETAQELLKTNNKTTQWIASNALKELEKEGVRISGYPRVISC